MAIRVTLGSRDIEVDGGNLAEVVDAVVSHEPHLERILRCGNGQVNPGILISVNRTWVRLYWYRGPFWRRRLTYTSPNDFNLNEGDIVSFVIPC
jgi:hypothetical protein